MVNVNMLKAKIIEKNIEKKKIAECLGISPTSLNYKINGKTEFKGSEIQLLSKILGIENEKDAYFFNQKVDKQPTTRILGDQMLRGALWTKKLNAVNIAFILTEPQTIAMKTTLILSSRILIGALITNLLNEKSRLHKNTAGKV